MHISYAKYGCAAVKSNCWRQREREVEGRAVKGDVSTQRAYGYEECDRNGTCG